MIEEKRCPKCGRKEKVKNGFMRWKQRYKCKNYGCNYTGGRNGYPEDVRTCLKSQIRYKLS
jgi:transposase-like protein